MLEREGECLKEGGWVFEREGGCLRERVGV